MPSRHVEKRLRSEFEYISPDSLREALRILQDCAGKVGIISGGTDLMLDVREGKLDAELLVDITRISELRFVVEAGDQISLGPLMTHAEIASSCPIMRWGPVLCKAAQSVGSPQIRNIGTIGGNIMNASPAADTIPALMVLEAQLVFKNVGGERTLSIVDLYSSPYKTVVGAQELLTKITFLKLEEGWKYSFRKLARRKALAIARINIAVLAKMEGEMAKEVKIAVGSCTPTPCRMWKSEALLKYKVPSSPLIEETAQNIFQEVIEKSGVRPSTEYKKHAIPELVKEALLDVFNLTYEA